jgi:hypothetical protein
VALRVYCGLASADESVRTASAALLTIAVVDDAGRLLGVHEMSDDVGGYAQLGSLLVERMSGFPDAEVAADSDDHLVISLLTAAGRRLAVTDDDSIDDFAERFADDSSAEEMQAGPAARRAVGLARALQAGAITTSPLSTPRELVSYKPLLAAHVALLNGRFAAAVALRETLRELYPAALRAYPDPSHPLALAVLHALPEPGPLTDNVAEQVAADLIRAGVGTDDEVIAAVTALQVAISESPRRGGVNKGLAETAGFAIRHAIASVRSSDAACAQLIGTIAERFTPATAGRRSGRRVAEPAALQSVPAAAESRFGRRSRPEPAATGNGPVTPHPLTTPPVAPAPMMPPPAAPRPVTPPPAAPAAVGFPNRAPAPGNRPVSVPPPPPGMTPITPGSRPAAARNPVAPTSAPIAPAASATTYGTPSGAAFPPATFPPATLPPASVSPADTGQPFRATLTNAAINSVRAERQRTVIPPRPTRTPAAPASPAAPAANGATDYSLPMPTQRPAQPTQRPAQEVLEPGSRANWPLLNSGDEAAVPPAASISAPPADNGRVKPPWQDMPKEPPALRLVDSQLRPGLDTTVSDLPPVSDPPSLRLVDREDRARNNGRTAIPRRNGSSASPSSSGMSTSSTTLTALDRSTTPPVPAEGNDGDLLIFAAARSAWFTGQSDAAADNLDWANPNDTGWRAAEKAATPAVAAETSAGLPKRVPQANLVPGSPLREERPLRIVRDAASIAAHTTGYFRGWRRGQEIGGFAMGGRPGRESAGGWDFTRDGQGDADYRNNAGYRTS